MNIQSVLHGYRVQFLYTLYRMILSDNIQEIFVPEGREDLDVYVGKVLKECIQVKCHTETISFGDMYSSKKKTSLYSRALASLDDNPEIEVKVVSINGQISDELTDKSKLKRRLKGDPTLKLKEQEAKKLANTINTAIYDEQKMLSEISLKLKSRFVEIDPVLGIRLLTEWIYEAAEHGERLTTQDLEQEIRAVAIFQSQIQTFHQQIGGAIVPLFMGNSLSDCDERALSDAFYSGVSVRAEHILAGLDIERKEIENDIETAFQKRNIVIVHGLSGAGKSTLAYRYIYENANAMAYEIRNCNPQNLNDILLSLRAITHGLRIPAMFYFDVNPSNQEWIEAITLLADRKDVRCLVTIRQEDWNIQYSQICSSFMFVDVTLELQREEAEHIYDRLLERGIVAHRSFEIVWEETGQTGNLMEFIYLLTHGETLENRIKSQICCESEQCKHLLGYIAISNYLGGNINLDGLVYLSYMNRTEVSSLIKRIEQEFFKIEDNEIKDIHPVRTKFIVKALFGNTPKFLKDIAMEIFNKLDIQEGHLYILRMAKECGLTVDMLLSEFASIILSPNQAYSIARALLWFGIYDYEKENNNLIGELSHEVGQLWEIFLPINFTDVDLHESLSFFEKSLPNFSDVTNTLSRFSNQQKIFCHLEKWLKSRSFCFHPTTHQEWFLLSKFLSLTSLASSKDVEISGFLNDQTIESKNLDECAQILLGLKKAGYVDFVSDYEKQFISCLRHKYSIIQFKKEENTLQMLSFLNYNADLNDDTKDHKGYITEKTNIRLIDICRCAFPEVKEYFSEILKDDLINLFKDMPTKKQIKRDNLPLEEMREPRAVLCNLYKKEKGIDNRETYANLVLLKRKDYIRANNILTHFLDEWHKNRRIAFKGYNQLIEELAVLANKIVLSAPTSEISEFGYGCSKRTIYEGNDTLTHPKLSDIFHDVDLFFSYLRNFYYQFPKAIVNEDNYRNTASSNLFEATMLLQSIQSNFRDVFGKYVPIEELEQIHEKEDKSINKLWIVWESLRDNFYYNNIHQLFLRHEQMKITLADKLADAIEKEWETNGFDRKRIQIRIRKKTLFAKFYFTSEDDYYGGLCCIQMAIAKKLATYEYFSSQRMILQNIIEKIVISSLYQIREGYEVSLDGQQITCNMGNLFAKADEVSKNHSSFFFLPEQVESEATTAELAVFNQLVSIISAVVWACNKLVAIHKQIRKGDFIARNIFNNFKQMCEKNIINTDVSIFESLYSIHIQELTDKILIINAIDTLKSLISSISSCRTWYLNADGLRKVLEQIDIFKMQIQMQLAYCDDLK